MIRIILALVAVALCGGRAWPHDIYSNLENDLGGKCCNGTADGETGDCAPTLARVEGNIVAYHVGGKVWVRVPAEHVRIEPVPGEEMQVHPPAPTGEVWGHFCGVPVNGHFIEVWRQHVFDGWIVYCAFLPPGGA